MKCPICKKTMKWKEGLLTSDGYRDPAVGRYYCVPCRVSAKMQESRALKKGRRMAKQFEGVRVLDKRMLALSQMEQLGILRERQKEWDDEPV